MQASDEILLGAAVFWKEHAMREEKRAEKAEMEAQRLRSECDEAKDRIKKLESERMRVWQQLVDLRNVIPPEGNFDLRRSIACIAEGSAWSPSDMPGYQKESDDG
jgi:hypothetical protein